MGSGGQNQEPGTVSASNVRRSRRRRGRRREYDEVPALDSPAPAASPLPQWRSRRLVSRTPQRLCTLEHPPPLRPEFRASGIHAGSAPCDPILAFDKYVVSATDDGRVCVYAITSFHRGSSTYQNDLIQTSTVNLGPIAVAGPFSKGITSSVAAPAIITLVATPTGVSAIGYRCKSGKVNESISRPPRFLGQVAVLTSEGSLHILEFKTQPLEVTMVHSFSTGLGCATCCTFHSNNDTDPQRDFLRVCIGYESGCLTDWAISAPISISVANAEAQQGTTAETFKRSQDLLTKQQATHEESNNERSWKVAWNEAKAQLLWRGSFDGSVKSVSSLGMQSHQENLVQGVKDAARESSNYLAVCVTYAECRRTTEESRGRVAPALSVEVINIALLERDFLPERATSGPPKGDLVSLPLARYCTWPEAGMEILDTTALGSGGAPERLGLSRARGIPSRGTDHLYALNSQKPAFAAALTEGTVALMHSYGKSSDESDDPISLSWGVAHQGNQLLLSYPCIGAGFVDLALFDEQQSSHHFACCLRGGTVYVIPVFERGAEPTCREQTEVTVFSCPDNVDFDSTFSTNRYVEGFAAGNISVEYSQERTLPVFVYAWVSGLMDVYVVGLRPNQHQPVKSLDTELHNIEDPGRTFRELVDNGTVMLLFDLLVSLKEREQLMEEQVWKDAWKECVGRETRVNAEQLIAELLREDSKDFRCFRSLLLCLSRERIAF